MRRLIVLLFTLVVVGCESDFEKCMNTEMPRSEGILGIEGERESGRLLTSMREFNTRMVTHDTAMGKWVDNNPPPNAPEYPEYTCSELSGRAGELCREGHDILKEKYDEAREIWEATPDGQSWVKLRDEEFERSALEIGVPSNEEEFQQKFDEYWNNLETVLKPRSSIYSCLEDYKCDEYNWGDVDDYNEIIEKSFAEAILNNSRDISDLVEKSKELATVTCNNNGFYE